MDASEVMVLSLWQPWATLMAIGAKRYETRCWSTKRRGLVAIHAGVSRKGCDAFAGPDGDVFTEVLTDAGYATGGSTLPMGKIVAVGTLVDCVPISGIDVECPHVWWDDYKIVRHRVDVVPAKYESFFGNYETPMTGAKQRYAWIFESVRALRSPLPFKGGQGLRQLEVMTALQVLAEAK